MPKPIVIDGEELPVPEAGTPVAQVIYLLEYARRRKFRIPTIQIGDVILQVEDLTQRPDSPKDERLDPDSDFGRIMLQER